MKKLLGILILYLLLSGNANSAILKYECYSPKQSSATIWVTSAKRTVDTEKKIMTMETNYTYKPLFKKIRYHSFRDEYKIEIDDQKIKYYGTNKSDWEWQYKVWEYKDYNYNDPKKLKKLIKKYGGLDKKISRSVWNYKKDRSPIMYTIYSDGVERKSNTTCVLLNKTAIAEKPKETPKKKKPKPNPDDNKIVAASSGTGFYVSNAGHIISNHHVVEGCNTVKLTFSISSTGLFFLGFSAIFFCSNFFSNLATSLLQTISSLINLPKSPSL